MSSKKCEEKVNLETLILYYLDLEDIKYSTLLKLNLE
nr:MAG TPA: hypothetical protein [Bacteriophage sp.]DAI39993.1 MAG TPA: hypothetical protein [Caudoviricetes sp.]